MTVREPSKPPATGKAPGARGESAIAVPPAPGFDPAEAIDTGEGAGTESVPSRPPRTTRGRGEPQKAGAVPKAPSGASQDPGAQGADSVDASGPGSRPASTAAISGLENAAPTVEPGAGQGKPTLPAGESSETAPSPNTRPAWLSPQFRAETPAYDLFPGQEELPHIGASRLSGLRKMLVALGRRSLARDEGEEGEFAAEGSDLEPRFKKATVRPADPGLAQEDAAAAAIRSEPVHVTALPEFLPPTPGAEPTLEAEAEKEEEPVRPTPPVPRRDSREVQDEIQTLPAWRGQYRKKRYPPI